MQTSSSDNHGSKAPHPESCQYLGTQGRLVGSCTWLGECLEKCCNPGFGRSIQILSNLQLTELRTLHTVSIQARRVRNKRATLKGGLADPADEGPKMRMSHAETACPRIEEQ